MTKQGSSNLTPPLGSSQAILELLTHVGKTLSLSSLYGPHHKITLESRESCYRLLKPLLLKHPRINLDIIENQLAINGDVIASSNRLMRIFTERLMAYDVTGLALLQGMQKKEWDALLDLLLQPLAAGEDFSGILAKRGMKHVQTEGFVYKRVGEKEVVINAEEIAQHRERTSTSDAIENFLQQMQPDDKLSPDDKARAAEAFLRDMAGDRPGSQSSSTAIQQIVAFLKGELSGSIETVSEDVIRLASDTEKLATLIAEAAVIRQRSSALPEGETLADFVVSCLRRTYDILRRDPEKQGPKGQQDVQKKLLLLEKSVLDQLHALMDQFGKQALEELDVAVTGLDQEVQLRTMTSEYIRRRQDLQHARKAILGYVESRGLSTKPDSDIPEMLMQVGMTSVGWRQLVAQPAALTGQASPGTAIQGPGSEVLGILAALLMELDTLMSKGVPDKKSAGNLMGQIGSEVNRLSEITKEKIDALGDHYQRSVRAEKDAARREQELEKTQLLAEIVQELCQPASAINCSVSMIHQGYIGTINREQRDVLGIAVSCGLQLTELLNLLREIVGVPLSLTPQKSLVQIEDNTQG